MRYPNNQNHNDATNNIRASDPRPADSPIVKDGGVLVVAGAEVWGEGVEVIEEEGFDVAVDMVVAVGEMLDVDPETPTGSTTLKPPE